MAPRVSVVIPFRDARLWLPECLSSLASVQGVAVEVVAVDDGSSDDSAAIVASYRSRFICPLRILDGGGRGVSAARNLGWRAGSNSLVAFLDADDRCLPGRLAGQAALLLGHAELAHVVSGWRRISSNGVTIKEVRPWEEGAGFDVPSVFRHKAVLPSAWMLRRSVLEATGGFDPALSQAEDVDLLLRLAVEGHQGTWWPHPGCDYRIHEHSASHQVRRQAHALLGVVRRQLDRLPQDSSSACLQAEVSHGTRVWAGWNAWRRGEGELAFELWRTSLGMSPFPPALTWVHIAENVARNAAREGERFRPMDLLEDPVWRRLEGHWCRVLAHRHLSKAPLPSHGDPWLRGGVALAKGRVFEGLSGWADAFRDDLNAFGGSDGPSAPELLRRTLPVGDPLRVLRSDVLLWAEDLLGRGADREQALTMADRLAGLMVRWTRLTWSEDRRPTSRRLEEAFSVKPCAELASALARVHRTENPTGAAALEQLSAALPSGGEEYVVFRSSSPAFWEHPTHQQDRCIAPSCRDCVERLLGDWRPLPLGNDVVLWQPPPLSPLPPRVPLAIEDLPDGQAWIRPPDINPWGLTHAVAVADRGGEVLTRFSRRYPIPWSTCPQPACTPEPLPAGEPLSLDGAVLAVADPSAENYFHWLLDTFPRIGLALETLRESEPIHSLRVWHNGGRSPIVQESLVEVLGLNPEQLIDARVHPHIRARRLLVPAFPSAFGWTSPLVQDWLRHTVLAKADRPNGEAAPAKLGKGSGRIWLERSLSGRRPPFGQEACLQRLALLGIRGLDPAGLGLRAQAQLLSKASLVVAPHGAALANLVFAQPGTKILELHQEGYAPPYFHSLAAHGRLLLARSRQRGRAPRLYQDLLYEGPGVEPILLDPDRVVQAVRELLEFGTASPDG